MNNIIVDISKERIKRQIQQYNDTGTIMLRSAMHGGDHKPIIYHNRDTFRTRRHQNMLNFRDDVEYEYEEIICNLSSTNPKIKYPTTLCNYRKGINPLIAMHQEYQRAILSDEISTAQEWIINLVENDIESLLKIAKNDLDTINCFVAKIKDNRFNENFDFMPSLLRLQKQFQNALHDFLLASEQ